MFDPTASSCLQVYKRAGFPAYEAELAKRGPEWQKVARWITYQTAPRAMIFRRDEGSIRDVEGMKRQMRYNDYKHDPVRVMPASSPCTLNPAPSTLDLQLTGSEDATQRPQLHLACRSGTPQQAAGH